MPRKRKLTPAAVRRIFKSAGSAKALAERYGVSTNLVHMIRQGRRHEKITAGLAAPKRVGGRKASRPAEVKIDIRALADALLERLIARLRRV